LTAEVDGASAAEYAETDRINTLILCEQSGVDRHSNICYYAFDEKENKIEECWINASDTSITPRKNKE